MMSRMIKLSDDTVEELMRDILIQDYNGIKDEIERLDNLPDKTPHNLEDLNYYTNLKNSMETVLSYYLPRETYRQVVGKDFS